LTRMDARRAENQQERAARLDRWIDRLAR
jgi:hypothetical protein